MRWKLDEVGRVLYDHAKYPKIWSFWVNLDFLKGDIYHVHKCVMCCRKSQKGEGSVEVLQQVRSYGRWEVDFLEKCCNDVL